MLWGGSRSLAVVSPLVVVLAGIGAALVPASSAAAPRTPHLAVVAATAPSSATLVIPTDAQHIGYGVSDITLAAGGTLSVLNNDSVTHTVTSVAVDADNQPLFDRTVAGDNSTIVTVPGASALANGDYPFYCRFHSFTMRATLHIRDGDGTGVTPATPRFEQPLVVPPVLNDAHIKIPIKVADVRVLPDGPRTRMWTYGGTYPGPTIVRPAGHDTKVTFVNRLPNRAGSLTVHFHGDHHSSANDGQPTRHLIRHGDRRTYDYPLTDHGKPERSASLWYHDHRMDRTTRNNWMGLQGMFIIHDRFERNLALPRGGHDLPLLVSERTFTSDNQLTHPFPKHPKMVTTGTNAPPDDGTVGKRILVNGRFAPYKRVSPTHYRLRLYNTSPFTPYDFVLSDGKPFVQIGTGNGLLPRPLLRQHILLGPAQRADVVVDFHGERGQRVLLESEPRPDKAPAGSIGSPSVAIMQFRVVKDPGPDHTLIPDRLRKPPRIDPPNKVRKTWTFDVAGNKTTGSYWTVNGKMFDPDRVDLRVPLGSTQVWRLHNASPVTHFIHIHEEQWHTLSRDGGRPYPWERGLEDTWKLDPGETVKVAARFSDHTGTFMIHCHMLDHEDHGLMAQFKVYRPKTSSTTTASFQSTATSGATAFRSTELSRLLVSGLGLSSRPGDAPFATVWPDARPAALPGSAEFFCGPEHDRRRA